MRKSLFCLNILTAVILANSAHALSLGEIKLQSHLSEPLKAEIDLLSRPGEDLSDLQLDFADKSVFERNGIVLPEAIQNSRFEIRQRDNGQYYVLMHSKEPLREPIISFLINASWQHGNITKAYDVLLNPPGKAPDQPTVAAAPPRWTDLSGAAEQAAPPTNLQNRKTSRITRQDGVHTYGPVQPGDVLSLIAQKLRPDPDMPLQDAMSVLLHANPDAFINQDKQRLKVGYQLHFPEAQVEQLLARADQEKSDTRLAAGETETTAPQSDNTALRGRIMRQADETDETTPPMNTEVAATPAVESSPPLTIVAADAPLPTDALPDVHEMREELETTLAMSRSLQAENEKLREEVLRLEAWVQQTAQALQVQQNEPARAETAPPPGSSPAASILSKPPASSSQPVFVANADASSEDPLMDGQTLLTALGGTLLLTASLVGLRSRFRPRFVSRWLQQLELRLHKKNRLKQVRL